MDEAIEAASDPPWGLCYKARLRSLSRYLVLPALLPVMPQSSDSANTTVLILGLVFLILSLGIHEAAHAWVAWKRGDSTAKDLGRMTLNPVPHIDPVMTILLPVLFYMSAGVLFGGAKPVPVLAQRLKHPLRDMMLVALAGPVSNVLLAMVFFLAWKVCGQYLDYGTDTVLMQSLMMGVYFNALLAVFNMIPIPPLDGSRVMTWLLPESMRAGYVSLERFGFMIILAMLYFGGLRTVIGQAMDPTLRFVQYVVTAGGAW